MDHAQPSGRPDRKLGETGPDGHRRVLQRGRRADLLAARVHGDAAGAVGSNDHVGGGRRRLRRGEAQGLQERIYPLAQPCTAVAHAKRAAEECIAFDGAGPVEAHRMPPVVFAWLGGRRIALVAERFALAKNLGHVGVGRVRRHGELLLQASGDFSRRLAVLEGAPDEGGAGVQRIEPMTRRVEQQSPLADEMNAELRKPVLVFDAHAPAGDTFRLQAGLNRRFMALRVTAL